MDISVNTSIQPTAFDCPQSYPYTQLDDRQFEKLLYSLFNVRIRQEAALQGQFDKVLLMPGVGEQGQDSILSKNGRRTGTIQCKQESTLLTKPDCVREIIKFILNAILDPEMLPDPQQFIYFFAVSKGFNGEATKLFASFNQKVVEEVDLEEWTEQVIKKNKLLQSLSYPVVASKLKAILQQIRVEPIIPIDLDHWLCQYPNVAATFFRLKVLETGSGKIVPATEFASSLPDQIIQGRFSSASRELQNCPATFENLPDSHIHRQETDRLLEWIQEPLRRIVGDSISNSPSVAVLAGDAGYGKTTVMRDLLLRLQQLTIPVIALKVDRLAITHRNQLTQELQLGDDLEKLVYTLSQHHERVVVIMDQLDALSQSLSADRQALRIYNRLVDQLAVLPSVRIVVSCRRYDLQYDPALVQYKEKYVIELPPLTHLEVEKIIGQLGFSKERLTDKLYDLLKVPLHLNVFCKVFRQVTDLTTLRTLQDLYHHLWRQKLLAIPLGSPTESTKLVALVRQLATIMYDKQQLNLSYLLYETEHKAELDYLRSQFLVSVEDGKIQFFHQSFFDYVFARTFVDKGLSISADVAGAPAHPKHQGLFIRSKVRQVISYLREVDPDTYHTEVNNFLSGLNYRVHIKLLVLQFIAFQPAPSAQEQRVVRKIVFKDSILREAFLEVVSSAGWFSFLIKANLIQPLLTTEYEVQWGLLYQLCRRVQEEAQDVVLQFLLRLPEFSQKHSFIKKILFVRSDFTDPAALQLFDKVETAEAVDDMWYFHVLENAVITHPEWVAAKILQRINQARAYPVDHKAEYLPVHQHDFSQVLKKLGSAKNRVLRRGKTTRVLNWGRQTKTTQEHVRFTNSLPSLSEHKRKEIRSEFQR